MQLSTAVNLPNLSFSWSPGTTFLSLGSCFAERIGHRLEQALFPGTVNPTGIYYNPVSLSRCLRSTINPPRLFLHQGLWRSLSHHSSLASSRSQESMRILVESEKKRLEALQNSEVMLLTLGTALVWETVDGGQVVANCHRLPSSLFRRRRLTVDETVHTLLPLIHHWLDLRESRQVVLTVSPVRYLRDGLVENSRGKSVLLLACEILEQSHPCLLYTSPSPRDRQKSRMPSSA